MTAENMPPLAAVVAERDPATAGRRHPPEVTADRLSEHVVKYGDFLTPRDLAAIAATVVALDQIPGRIRQAGDVE